MTSSMMAGERRWASARRGGMTVLGKVAVPKPINLPSQKLENHGLDPNVEIVPKGSLSWGSRPSSSSSSNPWGSSAISPNADGGTGSPSHLSGRPSSGGGLSRPSTAGSDRMHEATATTWGPNSRPSSASGVLTSNQSSLTSSRPLSAETRPGSSHLSRFAEPVVDNSVAWGPNGTADKLLTPSKVDDFSLSSGDFPTLGSEKDNASKSSESHDHGSHVRPGSASGRVVSAKERNEISQSADVSSANFKSGTVDTWTRDGPPHFEEGVRPNAEKWHGEPHQYVNPNIPPQHFDAWRGPPPMNAPAGVWYRGPHAGAPYPPVPHGGFPMEPFPYYRPQIPSQPGPPPGPGPRGHHPKNGDFYRPQMPDPFIRPGMTIRPGFYPGPVPYDGYYGPPPMGYNPNERDIPFMGMPPGPPVYNMYPPQNPSEINGCGPVGNMFVSEQMDPVRPEEPRGPYKVLKKRENERDANIEEDSSLSLEKRDQLRPSFQKNGRGTDTRRNEDAPSRRNTFVENQSSRILLGNNQGHPSDSKAFNDNWGKQPEIVAPQVIPANPKDSSLIQKIEGLNAKVRASDVRENAASSFLREEQKNVLTIDNNFKNTTASAPQFSRRVQHGVESRDHIHNKGRSNNQDTDGWRKKPSIFGSEPAALLSNHNVGNSSAFQAPDHQIFAEAAENLEIKSAGESLTQIIDPTDGQAQRAKMRELAKQRTIQLQKEEEERIREQKAKALAKLEELNRRTLAADGTTQTTEKNATSVPVQEDVGGSQKPTESVIDAGKPEAQSSDFDTKSQAVAQVAESSTNALSRDSNLHTPKNAQLEPVNDGSVPKQKRASQRQKQNVQVVEGSFDRSIPSGTISAVIQNPETSVVVSGEAAPGQESSVPNNLNIPKRRNNKNSKNKPKLDDASQSVSREGDVAKVSNLDPSTVLVTDSKDTNAMQSNLELKSEEAHGRTTNQFNKPQHSRRMPRNPQANRPADRFHGGDAVVWAPVRVQNKDEPGDEDSQRTVQDDMAQLEKSVNSVQTNQKSKRAEMERYVPKPVAKELAHAQQGSIQQSGPLSSPKKSTLDDMTDSEELGSKPALQVESKSGDNKQNKQAKPHGAWRQRGGPTPNEMPREQTNPRKNHQKSTNQNEVSNPVPVPTETNITHEWDPSDGWYMPEYPPVTSVVKDEGAVTGKGKKPAYKGQRSMVNNNNHDVDHKDINSAEIEKNQTDRPRSSHWQPKPQAYRGGQSSGGQPEEDTVAEYKNSRERKPVSFRGPNPGNVEDEAPFEQQHSLSGFRKYGGQNNRPGVQDNRRQHNAPVHRERQRQNLHFEYQPVGSNNNGSNKSGNFDAPADGSGNTGPRYKERGSGQSRRGGGNFYGRQSGGVRVEGGYE